VVVYRCGCTGTADLHEASLAQLRLTHDLWNALVSVHQQHVEAVAAAWQTHPDVAALTNALEGARRALEAATARATQERLRGRTTVVAATTRAEVAEARRAVGEAREAVRRAKATAYAALKPEFIDGLERCRAAVKARYAEFVQERGLYWATYNAVRDGFALAVQATKPGRAPARPAPEDGRVPSDGDPASGRRRPGRPPGAPRFRPWTGEGTLTVQLQRHADDPPRSAALLASGRGPWHNIVRLPGVDPEAWAEAGRPERRRMGRGTLRIRVAVAAGKPVWQELPVIWHRPLPPEGDVTQVRVTRRRIGGHMRVGVAVWGRLPTAAVRGDGPAVAIDLGWRSRGDGSLRTAVWAATGPPSRPLVVPPALLEVIRPDPDGRQGEVVLPASWVVERGRVAEIRNRRARKLAVLRQAVVAYLMAYPEVATAWTAAATAGRPTPEHGPASVISAEGVAGWRSPQRFVALAREHGDGPVIGAPLEAWRRADRHLWEWAANLSEQLSARRRSAWQVLGRS